MHGVAYKPITILNVSTSDDHTVVIGSTIFEVTAVEIAMNSSASNDYRIVIGFDVFTIIATDTIRQFIVILNAPTVNSSTFNGFIFDCYRVVSSVDGVDTASSGAAPTCQLSHPHDRADADRRREEGAVRMCGGIAVAPRLAKKTTNPGNRADLGSAGPRVPAAPGGARQITAAAADFVARNETAMEDDGE